MRGFSDDSILGSILGSYHIYLHIYIYPYIYIYIEIGLEYCTGGVGGNGQDDQEGNAPQSSLASAAAAFPSL